MSKLVDIKDIIDLMTPKNPPSVPDEVIKVRQCRKDKAINDVDYEKFWLKQERQEFLEKKSEIERYNQNCFIDLWDMFKNPKNEPYKTLILKKLGVFRTHIRNYEQKEPIFKCYRLDFNKFIFKDEKDLLMDSVNEQFSD